MIGIFDSGVGGLTVAREIKKRLPEKSMIYFGDTARVPWGNKSREVVSGYAEEICDFLISKGVDEIIIACNTASAYAAQYLREKYPDIKIYDVIEPVIKKIEEKSKNEKNMRIGVIGTRGTIFSQVYEKSIKKIDSKIEVYSKSCPLFVPFVEEGFGESEIAKIMVKEYLGEFKDKKITKLILGCTHYPMLRGVIENYLGKEVEILGSDEAIAEKLLDKENRIKSIPINEMNDEFYFSDLSSSYLQLAKNIYGEELKAKKVVL